jgi:hypothetical protein
MVTWLIATDTINFQASSSGLSFLIPVTPSPSAFLMRGC